MRMAVATPGNGGGNNGGNGGGNNGGNGAGGGQDDGVHRNLLTVLGMSENDGEFFTADQLGLYRNAHDSTLRLV